MTRLLGDISLHDAEPPYSTADLPDAVVNQRVYAVVAVSNDNARSGQWGLFVWMDKEGPDEALWTPDPATFRGQNGAGLTPEERRYVASHLHGAAAALLRTADDA